MTEDRSTPDKNTERPEGEPRFSFTDKRKVNPRNGSVRSSGATPRQRVRARLSLWIRSMPRRRSSSSRRRRAGQLVRPTPGRVAELEGQVIELTEQLKREQAEYVNSRRRIEGAAEVSKEGGRRVLGSLIGVLDDVELGRQHGDIPEGTPFHSIAQKLEEVLGSHGLKRFGAVGEQFDPNLHEALMHEDADDVQTATISLVIQPGYAMHDRILRPARVGTPGPRLIDVL